MNMTLNPLDSSSEVDTTSNTFMALRLLWNAHVMSLSMECMDPLMF